MLTVKCRHLAVQTLRGVLPLGMNMHCKVAEGDGNRSGVMLKGTQRFLITMALQLLQQIQSLHGVEAFKTFQRARFFVIQAEKMKGRAT